MGVPNPNRTEDWDVLFLGGQRVPGVAYVDVKLGSGLDVQKPKGGKKATIRDEGAPPAELDITIKLDPSKDEITKFQAFIPKLRPRSKSGAREPLEIGHPQAALWGINVVTVGDIDAPHPESGGFYMPRFRATEWAPAPVVVKPKPKPKPDDSEDWNVQPLIDELRPGGQSGAVQSNF